MSFDPDVRDADRQAFVAALGRALEGRPMLLVLEGERGVGKTALLEHLASSPHLPPRRIRVIRIAPRPDQPFDPVALAANALARPWQTAIRRRLRGIGPSIRKVLPDWIGALPWGNLVAAVLETVAVFRRPRGRDTGAARSSILSHARTRPVALFIDDLHLSDDEGADRFVATIASAETGTRLLVVAAARPPRPGERGSVLDRIRSLPSDRVVLRKLQPASDTNVRKWLETLGTEAAAVLRAAASIGPVFTGSAVAQATGSDELWVEDRLAECTRAGAIVEDGIVDLPDGDVASRYRFTSAALHAALRDGIDAPTAW